MSRHIAESRLNLIDHDKICFDSSWIPWVTGSCGAFRSGCKLTHATKCTKETNCEMKHTTSNPMKVSGKKEWIVPGSGLNTECDKSRICREIFVEPRGTLVNDIKCSWSSAERINEPKFGKSKRSARWNKSITHDNRVDCRQTSRDAADKGTDKKNCTDRSKKQHLKLPSVSELEQSCQSSSDCASIPSSFTVSCRSAANYFLKQQSVGPFKDRDNGKVHLNTQKYASENEGKTDIFSLSYPDNDSSHSLLKCYRSTSDSGDSSCNGSIKINDKDINNRNMRFSGNEIILDKNLRGNRKCLQDTTYKLPFIHSAVNAKRFNNVMKGTTSKGTGKTIGLVGEDGNSKLLQEPVRRDTFLRPHSKILLEKETTVSNNKKSFRAEDGKTAYRMDHSGEGDVLKASDKEKEQKGVQMSRSVELGIDVLLFAISRFKNIIKRCSGNLPTEGTEDDKEDVLERCVNELSSKLKTVHDNTTRLLVEVEEKSSSVAVGRPTTSAKQELDYLVGRRINDKHLHMSRRKVHSSSRPNTCFPSCTSRQYPPDASTMIHRRNGR